MSRQTTWVITGALSIVAIGGGTAVASMLGQSTDHDLGPAMEVTTTTEPQPTETASPAASESPRGSASPRASASPTATTTPSPTSAATPESAEEPPAQQPSAVNPAPPSTYQAPLDTPGSWSAQTPESWSAPSAQTWSAPSSA